MGLPPESVDISSAEEGFAVGFRRRFATERPVNPMKVVVIPELIELPLQVPNIPE